MTVETEVDPVDHSMSSRNHAQFIANQIAEEARICTNNFDHKILMSSRVHNHELASIEVKSTFGEQMMPPKGLESHDVYLIKWYPI